jgi:signal transduction histidine kinase/ActR/RegA family two-component response regulator
VNPAASTSQTPRQRVSDAASDQNVAATPQSNGDVPPERNDSRSPSLTEELIESKDITKDPATLGTVRESVRLLAAGVTFLYLGYSIYNLTRLDTPGVGRVMLFDQVAFVTAGLTCWLVHTRRVPDAWIHFFGATLALVVAADTSLSAFIYHDVGDLQYMFAIVIGGGAIVVSRGWLATVLLGTTALALPVALAVSTGNETVDFIVIYLGTCTLAVVIFLGRVRSHRRLLLFRIRDAQQTHELKEALRRAEREFEEHQSSERQKLALLDQLRQAQKLEALGTLAGGVAHDINNVIGAITAIASTTIQDLVPGTTVRQELLQILVAARRATTLTRNLVRFARQDQSSNGVFSLDEVVIEVEALLRRTLAKHIELKTNCGCHGWAVTGDSGLISHVLMNLCLNAADAISERGSIAVQTRALELDATEAQQLGVSPGNYVELLVRDDGRGMTAEVLERAFEPFFSTKESKRRSGLGLPMVYGTIQQHHGGLVIASHPGQGTSVRVVLPALARSVAEVARTIPKMPRVESQRPVALFVDDEPLLRRAGKRILGNLGYEVMLASNGRDALERFEKHRLRIGVVVLDVAMPVMSGAECCQELRRIDPDIPVILASGFPKGHDLQSLLAVPRTRYVRKPYELGDLASNLAELAEESRSSSRPPSRQSSRPSQRPPSHPSSRQF